MPRLGKTENLTAAVMFEQLPPGKLQAAVSRSIALGNGIMFGQTRSGKVAIVNIYSDDGKERIFADTTEELVQVLEDLAKM